MLFRKSALGILATTVISLLGCTVGPSFEVPPVDSAPSYRDVPTPTSALVDLPWWQVYQDQTLQRLIETALHENPDLGIALSRVRQAEAVLGVTRADLYPQLDLSASIARIDFENEARQQEERERSLLSAPVFWELDLFGKLRNATEAARAELLAAEYTRRGVALSLVAAVVSTYFQLLNFDNQLQIASETLESRKRSTKIIEERFQKGYVGQIDLLQATIEEQDAASSVHSLTRSVRQVENALSVLLGKAPFRIPRSDTRILSFPDFPEIPPGIPSELLKRRPDIVAAQENLRAQSARVGVAEALRFPALSLTGTAGTESLDLSEFNWSSDRFWSFSADLLGPLLSFNRNVSRVEAEEARLTQAALVYERTVLTAFREVEDALIDLETSKQELVARAEQVKAAKTAARLSRARYDGGETDYLEVLDIERSLFISELAESDAKRQVLTAFVNLYKALGGGWELAPASKGEVSSDGSE